MIVYIYILVDIHITKVDVSHTLANMGNVCSYDKDFNI